MIELYMDEHIRKAITTGLRLRGVNILTVQEEVLLISQGSKNFIEDILRPLIP